MPGSLDLVVEFPDSVEQIHSAFSNENYWQARLAALQKAVGRIIDRHGGVIHARCGTHVWSARKLPSRTVPAAAPRPTTDRPSA